MAYVISVIGQKGGVKKSTLSRLLAVEFSKLDDATWDVKIADLDISQGTSYQWMQRRAANGYSPDIRVEAMRLDRALKDADNFHVMILDGAPHATEDTQRAALASTLVVVPTGVGVDDLRPTVSLLHELKKKGVDPRRMMVVLTGVQDSEAEVNEARSYIAEAGYQVAKATVAEKTAYRRALDLGLALSEVKHRGLSHRASELFNELVAPLAELAEDTETKTETKKGNAA